MPKLKLANIAIVFLSACQTATEPEGPALHVTTAETEFELDRADGSAAVPFTVSNRGEATMLVARCGDRIMAALDREEDGRWVQIGDACLTIYPMSGLAVAPGESVHSTRTVGEPGRYRLRLGVSATAGAESTWTLTSPPFSVSR